MNKKAVIFVVLLPALAGAGFALVTRDAAPDGGSDASVSGGGGKRRSLTALAKAPDPRYQQRLQSVATHEFPDLIAGLQLLPQHQRGLAIELALVQWARVDIEAAVEFLELHAPADDESDPPTGDLEKLWLPTEGYRAVYQIWASVDLESAAAALDKDSAYIQLAPVVLRLSKTDPARAWELIEGADDQAGRELGAGVLTEWNRVDSDAAWAAAEQLRWGIRTKYFDLLVEHKPDEVRDRIQTGEPETASYLLRAWAEHDPDAAHAYARTLVDKPPFDSDPMRFFRHLPDIAELLSVDQLQVIADSLGPHSSWSEHQKYDFGILTGPRVWRRIVEEIDGAGSEHYFLRNLANAYGRENPAEGLEWLETLPEADDYRYAFFLGWRLRDHTEAVEHLAESPPSEELYRVAQAGADTAVFWNYRTIGVNALAWYESADPAKQRQLIAEMPGRVMNHDPEGVIVWSLENSTGDEPGNATIAALAQWFKTSESHAMEWLDAAAPPLRDQILARLVFDDPNYDDDPALDDPRDEPRRWALPSNEGVNPFDLVAGISDRSLRQDTLRRLVTIEDSSAVQTHLDNSEIPPAIRADVQELIDSGLGGTAD